MALLVPLLAVLAGSCGLETILALDAPTLTNASGLLSIVHAAANTSADFRGYQILYRVYDSEEAATKDYETLATQVSLAPDVAHQKLLDLKFLPLAFPGAEDDEEVLVVGAAERNEAVSFQVSYQDPAWPVTKIVANVESPVAPGARRVLPGAVKSLAVAELLVGDADYAGSLDQPATAYVVLCAIAIGMTDDATMVYSPPAVLSGGGQPNGMLLLER